jgi:hypothetical protein
MDSREMIEVQISTDKKYKTRIGTPARILCIDLKGPRPICAAIGGDGHEFVYAFYADGRFSFSGDDDLNLVEVSIYEDFKKDERVMVRSAGEEFWVRRYFSHAIDDTPYTFASGQTSWTSSGPVVSWHECRRPTPEELAG